MRALPFLAGLALLSSLALTSGCGDADFGGSASTPSYGQDTHSSSDASTSSDAPGPSQWQDPSGYPSTVADCSMGGYTDASGAPPAPGDEGDLAEPPVGPEPSGDEFEAPGTNPFTVVAHDPLSTFGADVDTASYEIFKRDIQQLSRLPAPASVRLEEFVNYFHYDYQAPAWEDEHPFRVALEAAPSAFSATTLIRVGLQGKIVPPDLKDPANLVFLVDVSGSMSSANKLGLVKVLLKETLEILDPDDTVAIVTYASREQIALRPTPVSQKAAIRAKIDGLQAGGSTAGQRGLAMAYEVARGAWIEGGINHVVLCTDGDFNVGISDTGDLVRFISEQRATGITLTVVGFGAGNLNDSMMEAVSNAGDGVYAYIGDADSAVAYANTRMLGSLYFVAKDLKIQVAFNPAEVYAYRLLGYENNAIADELFVDDTVDAGEIGSGHSVTALYELVLTGEALPSGEGAPEPLDGDAYAGDDVPAFAEGDLVEVRVRYKQPGASVEDPATAIDFKLNNRELQATFDEASGDLQFAAAVAAFAELLKGSPYARHANLSAIAPILTAQGERDPERAELVGLFEVARSLLEADGGLPRADADAGEF